MDTRKRRRPADLTHLLESVRPAWRRAYDVCGNPSACANKHKRCATTWTGRPRQAQTLRTGMTRSM